jgi:hypothetical protein
LALRSGWVLSKARNRGLLWRDDFGRMEWFETGRVNLHVRKPANLGRVKQLVSNGFSRTGLIEDFEVLEQVMKTIHFKEAHYVFDTGHPLPKGTIDFFGEKNGVTIKVGDSSHPKAVEVISRVPDWVEGHEVVMERLEVLLEVLLSQNAYAPNCAKKLDYVV